MFQSEKNVASVLKTAEFITFARVTRKDVIIRFHQINLKVDIEFKFILNIFILASYDC